MELKGYQAKVIDDLSFFLDAVLRTDGLGRAWCSYWEEKDVPVGLGGVPYYQDAPAGVPHVCMKVPTGGGKTFMACASLRRIFGSMPSERPKVVVWLVPSDAILSQTVRTLSEASHPYHRRLLSDFAGRVGIYTKDMLLSGQNFSPDTVSEMLTVCVMSYASLRIQSRKKDVRKVYQENGNLLRFAERFQDSSVLLADTPDTALIQVLRHLSPVVVVDESHNAGSDLSVEMLANLHPSFVLELTATPRSSSNILSYVDARELKKENMVKLPVVVFNRVNRQAVIQDAIQLRGNLERQALSAQARGGAYIRPIVLFQAQPNVNEESETFLKIRSMLTEMGIPEEEIAVKTSEVNDLGDTDLLSQDCPIRYIITVNALKEGWDCPFAYVLASLANKTSRVDVEQIVGRILRQPYARRQEAPLLNTSYVLTCSKDFYVTLDSIVAGLNLAGFSKKDYRVAENQAAEEESAFVQPSLVPENPTPNSEEVPESEASGADSFSDVDPSAVRENLERPENSTGADSSGAASASDGVEEMLEEATAQAEEYEREEEKNAGSHSLPAEWRNMVTQYRVSEMYREEIESLRIPQFFVQGVPDLFGSEYDLLEPDNLTEGFTLSGQGAKISFDLSMGEIYRVDLSKAGEAIPQSYRISQSDAQYMQKFLEHMPTEAKKRKCAQMISRQINRNDRIATADVEKYVSRVIENMSENELAVMAESIPTYARKIEERIAELEGAYRRELFEKWVETGKITCRPSYAFPEMISPMTAIDSIPYSLYEAEKNDMNDFERELLEVMVATGRIHWWHRVAERKGFCLNGYINHYPDFIVKTNSGKVLLIEAKGDYLDGEDSRNKLALGQRWAALAGNGYRYFMVFKRKNLSLTGAYTLDDFNELLKEM